MLAVAGDYAEYTRLKAETMHAQERREVVLRNTLRRETEWLGRKAAAFAVSLGAPAHGCTATAKLLRRQAVSLRFMSYRRITSSLWVGWLQGRSNPVYLVAALATICVPRYD